MCKYYYYESTTYQDRGSNMIWVKQLAVAVAVAVAVAISTFLLAWLIYGIWLTAPTIHTVILRADIAIHNCFLRYILLK